MVPWLFSEQASGHDALLNCHTVKSISTEGGFKSDTQKERVLNSSVTLIMAQVHGKVCNIFLLSEKGS